jgi:dihydroorotate dehydrogenase
MYKLIIRNFLFLFDAEKVHNFLLTFLKIAPFSKILQLLYIYRNPTLAREVFGIKFENPIGIAAGFDKNGEIISPLANLGFGFVEIGTVTPRAQTGNPKPRVFRLPDDEALLNRMGFNNDGMEQISKNLQKQKHTVVIGGNIGKNRDTANEDAYKDYEASFNTLYDLVDYFVLNVSSPNTPGLRELQVKEPLTKLLQKLKELNQKKVKEKPILLKIAPDLSEKELDDIINIVQLTGISGIIATNTTIARDSLFTDAEKIKLLGEGGVSGKPLSKRSTDVIRYIVKKSQNKIPVIGVGGIHSARDALEKFEAGAVLIQLYTGFIYEGPGLIKRIKKVLVKNNKYLKPLV